MLKNIFLWILQNIFGVKTQTTEKEITKNIEYSRAYEQIDKVNFNSIFANKIANYVVNDSNINITGTGKRVELLNNLAQSMWKRKMKKIVGIVLGTGGIAIVPYVKGGKLYYDLVGQDRITIDEKDGDDIIGATILAEKVVEKVAMIENTYMRWANYKIENNNLTITQKYTDEHGNEIPVPEFWQNIQEVMSISNVDKVTLGFITSPVNNRHASDDVYGVPITYGCEATINEIRECLTQIANEFELKEGFVMIDKAALGKDGKLPKKKLFSTIDSGVDDFWQVYDPAIRETSYYARLQELYSRLEKEIGTSAGILTEIETADATATAIKRAMYDTMVIVNDTRTNVEKGLEDFFYACDVLANAYKLTETGTYEIEYDWDTSLLEDSQETFAQLSSGVNLGVIEKYELRNWLKPSETLDKSKKAVDEIEQEQQDLNDLLGDNEEENTNENTNKNDEEQDQKEKEDKEKE